MQIERPEMMIFCSVILMESLEFHNVNLFVFIESYTHSTNAFHVRLEIIPAILQ